jgi:signal transduction histidine kinase
MRNPPGALSRINRAVAPHLSIQKRLPFLICILLLCTVATFSVISYMGMKKAALEVGTDRLNHLTQQLSSMFEESAKIQIAAIPKIADQAPIKKYLQSNGKDSVQEVIKAIHKLTLDTLFPFAELLNADKINVLVSGKNPFNTKPNINPALNLSSVGAALGTVGKIYTVSDSMYYPIIATVRHKDTVIGYIIRWRKLIATPKTLEQLSSLIGTNATLYFGNKDGKFWTDMIKPVHSPPIDRNSVEIFEYSRTDNNPILAAVRPVANTDWLILVEFSRNKVLEGVNHFLYWILAAGAILMGIGILIGWIMSRNITRPLNRLTKAATLIAQGNHSMVDNINRRDELGKLARAFNTMAVHVQNAREDLEQKVKDRTVRLEMVNKELEAFSYSVSHDLRAPLRAVSGYTMMLKEDYEPRLDAEANRIINVIISNTKMMGKLIDDLIAFSQMGRKELTAYPIDMKALAESCVTTLMETEISSTRKYKIQFGSLPSCFGDQSMIRQVWMNLIGNAIKYSSKEDEPIIEIGGIEEASRNVYFMKDNGVGFDMQYAHKLFGVFQRLHNQHAFEGTGIGLALVKRIVHKHHGEVWAESSPGKGASFYFCLPKNNVYEHS